MYTLKTPDITDAKSFAVRAVPDAEVAAIQGDSFVHRNRFADAEPLLKKSLQLDPMNVPARESLGLMEFEKRESCGKPSVGCAMRSNFIPRIT